MRSTTTCFTRFLLLFTLFVSSLARTIGGRPEGWIQPYKRAPLQDIVTWDNSSLLVHGQRIMFYSGEFHPFRLPVPSLWLDIFQKIRSMGYNGVSFYVDWALLEGKPGEFSAKGVFALEPFFEAAKQAGIYLLARPGPYINAEVSGGGFPGWLQRVKGHPRTADASFLAATELYAKSVGAIIAKAQITKGGPVILFQPENEYTGAAPGFKFPDPKYFQYVQDQFRAAGIVVPFMSNDANPGGHNAPGQPAAVDIYGHDGYPLGFDCANPTVWPAGKLPTNWTDIHLKQSPTTPYSIPEFQGGSFDPWGGPGFEQCAALLNQEFERVFYKNAFSFGVTIFNLYMTYGGTNWGNLGHAGGYTSYDYGAVITEDRSVNREKYSEAKLEASFIVASPSYLTAVPGRSRSDAYYTTSRDVTVTPLRSGVTKYLVVRHKDYASLAKTFYRLILNNTSAGDLTVPLAGGTLTLHGRDSKIHVVDYMMGNINLLYSTAEILTWKRFKGRTTLVVYSGPDEQHEIGVSLSSGKTLPTTLLGSGVNAAIVNGVTVLSWRTTAADRALRLGPLDIYFIDRNSAYQHWVLEVPRNTTNDTPYANTAASHLILKGGYLMRTARISDTTLALTGDLAPTEQLSQSLRIISGAPPKMTRLTFNGEELGFRRNADGIITAALTYNEPSLSLPNLADLNWNYADSLPEIRPTYSDATWAKADFPKTDNTLRNLTTPTSLYGSDYGYHTGALIYRGRFKSNGNESTLYLNASGGSGFGTSAWLDSYFLGSFVGFDAATSSNKTFRIPRLISDRDHVLTIVVDNMGLDENFIVGLDEMKNPRGILDFRLSGHAKKDVTWKLTGNFGGENFPDKARGPLNEGGLWAERQGYHLPSPPVEGWAKVKGGPMQGIAKAGIGFFTTSFELNMPRGYDIPLSIVFSNGTSPRPDPPPSGTSNPPSNPPPMVTVPPIVIPPPASIPPPPKPEPPTTPPTRPPPPVKPPPEKPPPVTQPTVNLPPNSTNATTPVVPAVPKTADIPTNPKPTTPPTTSVPQTPNGTVPWESSVSTQFGNPLPKANSSSSPQVPPPPPLTTWDSPASTQFGDGPSRAPPGTPDVPKPEDTWPSVTRSDQRTGKTTTPFLTTNSTSNSTLPSTTTILDWTITWTSTTLLPPPSTSTPDLPAPPAPPAPPSTPAPTLPPSPPLNSLPPPVAPPVPPASAPAKASPTPGTYSGPDNAASPTPTEPNQAPPKPANPIIQPPPKPVNPNQILPWPVNPNQTPPWPVNPNQIPPWPVDSNQVPPKPKYPDQGVPRPSNPNRPPPSDPRAKDPFQTTPINGIPGFPVPRPINQPRPASPTWPSTNPSQPFADPKWPNKEFPGGVPNPPNYPNYPNNQAIYPDFEDSERSELEQAVQQPGSQELPPNPLGEIPYLDNVDRLPIRTHLSTNASSSYPSVFSQIDVAEAEVPPEDPQPFPSFRLQIFVNGWQFGKYVSNIGPQTKFPVPEGIWNYHGMNTLSMTFWALDRQGARVEDVRLVAGPAIVTGYKNVEVVESPKWVLRRGAY